MTLYQPNNQLICKHPSLHTFMICFSQAERHSLLTVWTCSISAAVSGALPPLQTVRQWRVESWWCESSVLHKTNIVSGILWVWSTEFSTRYQVIGNK